MSRVSLSCFDIGNLSQQSARYLLFFIAFLSPHSVWKPQKKSHTTLRAKRATFSIWRVLTNWSYQSNSVTRHTTFNWTKIDRKCQRSKFKCDIFGDFKTLCRSLSLLLGGTKGAAFQYWPKNQFARLLRTLNFSTLIQPGGFFGSMKKSSVISTSRISSLYKSFFYYETHVSNTTLTDNEEKALLSKTSIRLSWLKMIDYSKLFCI